MDEEELDDEDKDEEELEDFLRSSPEQPVNDIKHNPAMAIAYLVAQYFLVEKNISIIPSDYLEG